ncbi:MAG: hypothetical protein ACE5GA_11510, partial [Candidatus Zixiibacteriota bacterium]
VRPGTMLSLISNSKVVIKKPPPRSNDSSTGVDMSGNRSCRADSGDARKRLATRDTATTLVRNTVREYHLIPVTSVDPNGGRRLTNMTTSDGPRSESLTSFGQASRYFT